MGQCFCSYDNSSLIFRQKSRDEVLSLFKAAVNDRVKSEKTVFETETNSSALKRLVLLPIGAQKSCAVIGTVSHKDNS